MSNSEVTSKKCLPAYQDAGHFTLAKAFSVDALNSALWYKPRDDDLFIVTYPKCGTTWVQNIVACIYRDGVPFSTAVEFLTSTPFLEMTGAEGAKSMKRPGAIKLHLPFHLTPYSPNAKYIFVARNPKDCCVSFYHHTKNLPLYEFEDGEFNDFFELFIDGKVDFGDYFDTLLSWYEHKNDKNVLFLTYEELKKDTENNVLRIAEFMGKEYKEKLETNPKLLKDVVYYSSFNYMKEFLNKKFEEMSSLPPDTIRNNPDIPNELKMMFLNQGLQVFSKPGKQSQFIRKGIVGDWRNLFSEEQNHRMDEKFKERTKGTDIPKLWQDVM